MLESLKVTQFNNKDKRDAAGQKFSLCSAANNAARERNYTLSAINYSLFIR
ncbi:MAG: hypothetical protein LH472_06290 [Pyrinomonadaceae bacterium]|nr:hypothetical protein [Pyrinomonadaceae bacterium]